MAIITDKTIQSWLIASKKLPKDKPKPKQVRHKIEPCLYLRISTATGIGYFEYRVAKFKTYKAIGEYPLVSLHEARTKAQELKGLVSNDINPIKHERETEAKKKTAGDVFALMLQSIINKGSTKNSLMMLNTFKNKYLAIVADYKMESLTPALIRAMILDPLIDGKMKPAAYQCLQRFKQMAKFAYEREYTETNVLARLKNDFFTPREDDRFLTKEEISKFLTWLRSHNDTPAKHLMLSLMLGNRIDELLVLKWDNVSLADGTIKFTETKNKQDLTIKLPRQALDVIKELHSIRHSDYVFANGKNPFCQHTIATRIKELMADTGVAKFTAHDLRRTFSTHLVGLGDNNLKSYSMDLIDCATNHKLTKIRRSYVHTEKLQERYEMLQVWADYLDSLVV